MMASVTAAAATTVEMSAPSPRPRILEAIRSFAREYGHSPTVRDIGQATGLVPSAVHYHLLVMERDGLITRCRCGCARPVAS